MTARESQNSSFSYEEKYGEKGKIIKEMVEALGNSNTALTLNELRGKIGYSIISDFVIESAVNQSKEIKHKNIEQVVKEFNLKKYSFLTNPKMRIFYLNEEQVKNFAKKSPYYS
ncbi:MAG: hypothetical protein NTZ84_03700 [Candidatus Nealsonbacteria bacterium]|nr:hypothetical protein [Candidatus Nealsonbacteria bacterium]